MDCRSISYCDGTRSADDMFSRFRKERDIILESLYENPSLLNNLWREESPLSIDRTCQCRVGTGIPRTSFVCPQCKNIDRLVGFRNPIVGIPFTVKSGSESGNSVLITEYPGVDLGIKLDPVAKVRAYAIISQDQGLKMCGTSTVPTEYFSADHLTNTLFQSWIVQKTLQEEGINAYARTHTAFVCADKGYLVQEYISPGNFDHIKIDSQTIQTSILQLVSILKALNKIQFTHGHISIDTIVIRPIKTSYIYDGKMIKGKVTLQLTDFEHSSSTINNHRIFLRADQPISQMIIPRVQREEGYCGKTDPCTIHTYQVANDNISLFIRHAGLPLFPGSFDMYCSMIALMTETDFRTIIMSEPELYRLWAMMWFPSDLLIVENRIRSLKIRPTHSDIVNILRDLTLRCDVLDLLWSQM